MNSGQRPVCQVCHRPIEVNDQYLVRNSGRRTTVVHRSVCFPPARSADAPRPDVRRAA